MNNEPVAYACQIVEADFETNILKIEMLDENYKVSAGIKYLCDTHPVKELTDDEIIKTMVQFDVYSSDDHCLIEAGRAILRKAQEK